MRSAKPFLSGVAEGFYGRPWNARQRHQLFGWMRDWGLNTYLYAPKDDLKHRLLWREPYAETEVAELAALIRDSQRHGLRFIYGVSPGISIRYSSVQEFERLTAKLSQVLELGCRDFALLCDDIPASIHSEDAARFGSLASAHGYLANEVFRFLRQCVKEGRFLFCPTAYCGVMAENQPEYLPALGQLLDPEIDVLWTGPQVVSPEIPVNSIQQLESIIQRKPVIWDNLQANDYDLQRCFTGPYSGRSLSFRDAVAGVLTNPNCQFELNFVPIRTLSLYLSDARSVWSPREAYVQAQREWLASFETWDGHVLTAEELEFFGDCFYLPHECGDRARQFLDDLALLLETPVEKWDDAFARVRANCQRLADAIAKLSAMRNRELLYALYPFAWALRAELDLVLAYLDWRRAGQAGRFVSAEEMLGITRGGLLAHLRESMARHLRH